MQKLQKLLPWLSYSDSVLLGLLFSRFSTTLKVLIMVWVWRLPWGLIRGIVLEFLQKGHANYRCHGMVGPCVYLNFIPVNLSFQRCNATTPDSFETLYGYPMQSFLLWSCNTAFRYWCESIACLYSNCPLLPRVQWKHNCWHCWSHCQDTIEDSWIHVCELGLRLQHWIPRKRWHPHSKYYSLPAW